MIFLLAVHKNSQWTRLCDTETSHVSLWSGFIRACSVALLCSGGSKGSNSQIFRILFRKDSPTVYFVWSCSHNLELRSVTSSTISSCSEDQKSQLGRLSLSLLAKIAKNFLIVLQAGEGFLSWQLCGELAATYRCTKREIYIIPEKDLTMLELSDSFAPSGFPSQFFRLKSWFKYFKKNMITFILTSANLSWH